MNTSIVPGSDKVLDQTIRSTFGKLDEADISAIGGDREILLLKLMQLYGFSNGEAQERVQRMNQRALQTV